MPLPNMTAAPGTKEVNQELGKLNKGRRYELTKYQQRQIDEAKPFYIYNVSTIHEWPKFQGQLGTLVIPKCKSGEEVSTPLRIPGAVARWYDKGLGRKEVFIEDGREIAEDICGCSKEYPAESSNNNLTNFGVFITDRLFEELPKKEQEKILGEAQEKFILKLRELMLEADNYHSAEATKRFVGKIHVAALEAFNEITGSEERRPWAMVKGSKQTAVKTVPTADCPFCGHPNKAGVPKCANCKDVINKEAYEALKKKHGG